MKKTTIQTVPSLISREASTAIKGLLMLLIILGHTEMLTPNYASGERSFLYYWLYSFHVFIFFIFPFIYGNKKRAFVNGRRIDTDKSYMGWQLVDNQNVINDTKHNVIKLGVPYFVFFLFSALVFVVAGKGEFNVGGMLYAFFFGNEPLIDKYAGFNYLWFLPAMLALLFLKSILYNSTLIVKRIIIVISVVLWGLTIFKFFTRYEYWRKSL